MAPRLMKCMMKMVCVFACNGTHFFGLVAQGNLHAWAASRRGGFSHGSNLCAIEAMDSKRNNKYVQYCTLFSMQKCQKNVTISFNTMNPCSPIVLENVENMPWTDFDDHVGVYSGTIDQSTKLPQGEGTFISDSNGSVIVCKGRFVQGKVDGFGTFTRHDKMSGKQLDAKYEGQWKNDRPHGRGQYYYEDGRVYNGDVDLDGVAHGNGVMTFPDGRIYDGQWKENRICGHGTLTFSDGSQYVGEFRDAMHSGHGIHKYADGSTYDGEHKDNQRDGNGLYKYSDGSQYDGQWQNGQRHGNGTYTFPNGSQYDGKWENGNKHGHGQMTFENRERHVGVWKDDLRNGIFTIYHTDAIRETIEYANGEPVQKWRIDQNIPNHAPSA